MDIQLEKKKGIQKKHIPYIAGGAIVLFLLIWIIFGNHASTLRIEGDALNIADVTYGEFNDYIRLNGQVQPISIVQLSPEEGGIVQEKVVEEGAHVKKGDIILRLSNSNLDLQILNAESELAEKQNLLRNTQVTMQQDKLNNETEKVQLDVDTRRKLRTFQQYERLYRERLISREEFLQAEEDYQVAQKQHALISERLIQDSIYRTIQMDQMEDNLHNMRQNVLLIRERKDKLEVRAPIDGELGLLDVELGQNITAGQMVGQINDLSDFKIEAMIDEHYIDRVTNGLPASFERQGATFRLKVRKVYPEVREGRFRKHPQRTDLLHRPATGRTHPKRPHPERHLLPSDGRQLDFRPRQRRQESLPPPNPHRTPEPAILRGIGRPGERRTGHRLRLRKLQRQRSAHPEVNFSPQITQIKIID